jgi:hypothetical protein
VDELARLARPDEVLLVAQGTPQQAQEFFRGRWPEARVVSDTDRRLYPAFGLRRAGLGDLLSPKVFKAFWRNRRHGVGRPVGDTLLLSGAFVVDGGALTFEHRSENPADHPDWATLLVRVREARGRG